MSTPKSIDSDIVDLSDASGRSLGTRSPVADLIENSRVAVSLPGNRPSRLARRPRARIHRTRSEHVIHAEDLPESALTATLADTDPRGLRASVPEGRLYAEENNRRCQNWLAGIEAAEPLDTVDYTTEQRPPSKADTAPAVIYSTKHYEAIEEDVEPSTQTKEVFIPIYDVQQEVDVEVPEETFVWDISKNIEHGSQNSDREMCSVYKPITFSKESEKTSGKTSQNSICSRMISQKCSNIQETGNAPKIKRDSSSNNCSAKMSTCFKKTCGKKIYKLCCEDSCSSSQIENDGSECPGAADECVTDLKHRDVQEGNGISQSSVLSVNASNARSTSTRPKTKKSLSDSKLTA